MLNKLDCFGILYVAGSGSRTKEVYSISFLIV